MKQTADITAILPIIAEANISDIDIPEDRARSFDPDEAHALSVIIASTGGMQHPIRLRMVGNRFRLVAGHKRLEAARLLGWTAIPYTLSKAKNDDEARLEEVMENLGRPALRALDRCQHLFELKQVHERLYPAVKHGGDRKSEIKWQTLPLDTATVSAPEIFGFSVTIAEKVGLSDRAIRLAVKIWTGLTPDSRKRCTGTRLADNQSALKELSEQSPADQGKVLDLVFVEPPISVADAVEALKTGVVQTPVEKKAEAARNALKSLPQPVASSIASAQSAAARLAEFQKGIATLSKFFGGLKDDELDTVIAEHEERVIASLKRRGRI